MEIDRHLRQQLQNKEIPLGEILKEKGFISLSQLEEALEISLSLSLSLKPGRTIRASTFRAWPY